MVKAKLLKLKMNKAPGADLVGTNMLVELGDEISDTVADLFNKSLITGEVPPDWKLGNVTPIFKKGKKSSVCNYRPVSLTVNLCKVFESILRDNMIEHLQRHTITIIRPFFRDHPGEPVPEENLWTLRCQRRLTEADTTTIRLGSPYPDQSVTTSTILLAKP